jgi:ABC-2 type transport system ATP-binding protein
VVESLVEIQDLAHRYGTTQALVDVNLEIRPAEVLALVGRNGAGKTTLMQLIVSLLDVQSGRLVRHTDRIGYCPQDMRLWPDLTAREQLKFMASMQEVDPADALDVAGALGLMAQLDTLAARLSGGQQRRLSVALALLHKPPLLVLDEPEVGLDPVARVELREVLRRLAREGVGILLASHSLDEVERLADRVAVIETGRVVAIGSPVELAGEGRLEDRFLS